MTALIVAVKGGYTQSVKEILKRNPNVNLTDKDGNTALMIASKEGHTEIVQDLLDAGTYVNIPDRVGACWSSSDVGGRRPQCPTTSLGSSCTRAFSRGLLVPQSPPFRERPLCRGIFRKSSCIIRTDLLQSALVCCSFPYGLSAEWGHRADRRRQRRPRGNRPRAAPEVCRHRHSRAGTCGCGWLARRLMGCQVG